ncbi:MAG: hypothetical protein LBR72_07375 [Oscillospiraceae bacterium]|nr:hypothetical protein [Oscillospiraceae bacterium]
MTLRRIEDLTEEQTSLIEREDKSALERNLEEKDRLIRALKGRTVNGDDEARAVLERIVALEKENIARAKAEMEVLRSSLKKTQEGLTAVRGYDVIRANVGATYIDTKN